jgi:hypothetical protein
MNERIRQLADEAKMSTYLLAYGLEFNISIEKFAELIVQECLDIVNRHEYSYHEADPLWETDQLIKEHFGVDAQLIKEHFGVES